MQLDQAAGTALSIQYAGYSATQELDAFLTWMRRDEPVRLREGPAVVRRRLAELVVRGPPRPHRVLHQRRAAAARGPAGRPRRRRPAVPGAERDRRQRVAAGRAPLRPARPCRTRSCRWPRCRTRSTRATGSSSARTTTRPAPRWTTTRSTSSGPGGGIYYLNPGYDGLRAGRITEALRAAAAARQARRRATWPADPGRHRAAGRGVLRAADRRGAAAGARVRRRRSCGRWRATRRWSRRSSGWPPGTTRPRPGSREGYDAADVDGQLSAPSAREQADERRGHALRGLAEPVPRVDYGRGRPAAGRAAWWTASGR